MFKTKSVYDPAEDGDGERILVTRYWPRGCRANAWHSPTAEPARARELTGRAPRRKASSHPHRRPPPYGNRVVCLPGSVRIPVRMDTRFGPARRSVHATPESPSSLLRDSLAVWSEIRSSGERLLSHLLSPDSRAILPITSR